MTPAYSIVIPTFRRGDSLAECLESVCALAYPRDRIEVVIIDNGGPENTQAAAEPFMGRLQIRYLVNPKNRGYGFSVNRGIVESTGDRILLLNDDARPMPDVLRKCDELLNKDASIGCVGFRAIEKSYQVTGTGIGRILGNGVVEANFVLDGDEPIEVEHVYGFCYIFTRDAVRRAGLNDCTLLAQPYSSGNRIETDHCLSIREAGLRVMYHPKMAAIHLAKPRPDMSEVSPRWHRNSIRNTIYLYLKHYGPFGKSAAALRLTFLDDVGVLSMIKKPTGTNIRYFAHGLGSRTSAWWHWLKFLAGPRKDSEAAVRRLLDADVRAGAPLAPTASGQGAG